MYRQLFVSHALPFSFVRRTFEGLPSVTRPYATRPHPSSCICSLIGAFNPGLQKLARWLVKSAVNLPQKSIYSRLWADQVYPFRLMLHLTVTKSFFEVAFV